MFLMLQVMLMRFLWLFTADSVVAASRGEKNELLCNTCVMCCHERFLGLGMTGKKREKRRE